MPATQFDNQGVTQALGLHGAGQSGRGGLGHAGGKRGFDQFHAQHQATAAHISQFGVLSHQHEPSSE
ncbi:hypothetical protein D3C71_1054340 [compost metagenome]